MGEGSLKIERGVLASCFTCGISHVIPLLGACLVLETFLSLCFQEVGFEQVPSFDCDGGPFTTFVVV